MTVHLPLILVLAGIGWGAIKFLRIRLWLVIVLLLVGFLLSKTFLAPAIDSGTHTGTDIVNGTTH